MQITYTIMFALTNSLTSDALGGSQEMGSILALDAGFRKEFQQMVIPFPKYNLRLESVEWISSSGRMYPFVASFHFALLNHLL